ncbi:MAG: L-histidine N(alpha)-methyltransferase [Cyclobacteriaceae bacterium]
MNDTFETDIIEGLQLEQKHIPSKHFYDDKGDKLFQKIMELPEYYLTRLEMKILKAEKSEIFKGLEKNEHFRLIELGAGDGQKTLVLLKYLLKKRYDFIYNPVDISADVLKTLEQKLLRNTKGLSFKLINAEYFEALQKLRFEENGRNILLFLGSNVGNFNQHETVEFYKHIHELLNPGDRIITGFDLVKDPFKILAAYNDSQGVTAKFNLNLLKRINSYFDANISINRFGHYPMYNPTTGEAKSFLVSRANQQVHLKKVGIKIDFYKGETIQTEVSRKFTLSKIQQIAEMTGFAVLKNHMDKHEEYAVSVWEKTQPNI